MFGGEISNPSFEERMEKREGHEQREAGGRVEGKSGERNRERERKKKRKTAKAADMLSNKCKLSGSTRNAKRDTI